jgi:DNA-binding MarR family transcriptional regulator
MGTHTLAATNDTRRILDSIRQIVQVLRLSATAAEHALNLSAAQLFVIHKLGEGEGISMNELSRRTHTHQSSVSVVVRRLVEKRLVRRQRSATDRRQLKLQLTAAGLRKLRIAPQAAQNRLIDSLLKMPNSDRRNLARLLEDFVAGTGVAAARPELFFEESPVKRRKKSNGGKGS